MGITFYSETSRLIANQATLRMPNFFEKEVSLISQNQTLLHAFMEMLFTVQGPAQRPERSEKLRARVSGNFFRASFWRQIKHHNVMRLRHLLVCLRNSVNASVVVSSFIIYSSINSVTQTYKLHLWP